MGDGEEGRKKRRNESRELKREGRKERAMRGIKRPTK